MYSGLSLEHVEMASNVLKSVPTWYARKKPELSFLEVLGSCQVSRQGGDILGSRITVSSGAMTAPFPLTHYYGLENTAVRHFCSDFLIPIVHEEMAADK